MPATTMGANENFLSYMSTLSLSPRCKEKKWNGERGKACVKMREIRTHTTEGGIKDLGKSLCLFQLKLHIAFNDSSGVFNAGEKEREAVEP